MKHLLLVTLLLGACGAAGATLPRAELTLGEHTVTVEVAHTLETRRVGLMNRDAMPADAGMVFVYPEAAVRGFWMKDTRIPLSIAFLDADGVVKRIASMRPFDTSRTSSLYPAKFAIEMNVGWFEAHGVKVGDTVGGIGALPAATE